MKETYNIKNKKWEKETPVNLDEVEAIIGKGVEIIVDSNGNITINKELTPEEKTKIEGLR